MLINLITRERVNVCWILYCHGYILVTIHFIHLNDITVATICLVGTFPYFLGYGIFEANVIQFGTDQLQFAPSQELSSFVYWVLYIRYPLLAFILLMASTITATVYKKYNLFYLILQFWLWCTYCHHCSFVFLLFQTSLGY